MAQLNNENLMQQNCKLHTDKTEKKFAEPLSWAVSSLFLSVKRSNLRALNVDMMGVEAISQKLNGCYKV